jgi:hypothetical protein
MTPAGEPHDVVWAGTIPAMPGPNGDPCAGRLLERYRQTFGGDLTPARVESVAQDFLGLRVGERDDLDCSGVIVPAQRQNWVNAREAAESPGRRRRPRI